MKIAVLGLGHMGLWLANQFAGEHDVAAFDPLPVPEFQGRRLAAIDALAGFAPDLLVNAVSLQHTIEVFRAALPHLPHRCMLCDIASVKTGFADFYLTAGFPFISVHPMFGPTFADMQKVREENGIIIKESATEGKEFFRALFTELGVRQFEFTFDEHDRMMAYSLTTPFVTSLIFAACVEKTVVPGTTFARHKRIADGLLSEDDHLIAEILFNPHSISQIEKMNARLEFLKHVIRARDTEEVRKVLSKLRENLSKQ